jgi:nucleotide-binding universal stress UspA family protein
VWEYAHRIDALEADVRAQVEAEVAKVRAQRGDTGRVPLLTVRRGNPYREVLRYVAEVGAEHLVVGTHGHTGIGHVLGSVAERLVRHAPCTVTVVKSPEVCAHLAAAVRTGRRG